MALPPFRKLDETELLRTSLIRVASARFAGPGGQEIRRDIVHHPGAVVIVPLTSSGTVLMVRQFRAAVNGELLEIPAGKRDVLEEPTEVTAARELAEEIGQQAAHLELLARFYNSPGFSDELSWLYLARDLTPVPENRQGAEEQHMTVEEVPLAEARDRIASGQIVDAKSIIGLMLTTSLLLTAKLPASERPASTG
jgi:8-oxo-dGTP pyrophosphatase MutT (NUDIX family)